MVGMTCQGLNKHGDRARFGLSRGGFCRAHHVADTQPCQGKCKDGMPCTAPRKPRYEYCSAAHDPRLYYVSPGLFGKENLRAEKIGVVAEYYGGVDLYHRERLDAKRLPDYQVDRVLERQCFAFATVQAGITRKRDQEWVASFIRDEIASRTKNLCITRKETKAVKGLACFLFLDDYVTGHREHGDASTLDMYLQRQSLNGRQLERATRLRIRKAMGKKVKFSQHKLSDEGDTPEFERIACELQKMYLDMDLKVGSLA